jgi:hypothetical protein
MRPAVVTVAMLTIGGQSIALADPPVTPATPESAAGPASGPTPAPAPAAPAKPAPSTSSTSGERMLGQQLRLQGYRLSMVRGEEKYCRREAPLGSRLESAMHCVTLAEAQVMVREGKETTERIQRNQTACLQPAMGGCGH